ncbi:hypothetical protein GCM10010510_19800 [Streptomyces anandii JCM 4720]|nr:hypothetical protein GCM10010510_19800 [Streptomyces anandii JCM 4720]
MLGAVTDPKRILPATVTLGAVALAVAHTVWPQLKIDTLTVVLLGVAVLPWIGGVVDSIEFPGGGAVRYRNLEQRVEAAERSTRQVRGEVGEAAQTAQAALGAASAGSALDRTAVRAGERVAELAARYEEIRARPRGPARSEAMNRLVGELMTWTVRAADFDPGQALRSTDSGTRLAAYAYLYATPETQYLDRLVRALVEVEDKPFSHYWGIRALGGLLQAGGGTLSAGDVERLRARYADLSPTTSRRMELDRLLSIPAIPRQGD